jgi:hypothetical protein
MIMYVNAISSTILMLTSLFEQNAEYCFSVYYVNLMIKYS